MSFDGERKELTVNIQFSFNALFGVTRHFLRQENSLFANVKAAKVNSSPFFDFPTTEKKGRFSIVQVSFFLAAL